ncbi:MAG TPA: metallophosphoesterase, partial [Streptosporangiaceae bacterium]|nr:metallophosphoesterase [Streptosporangiaceae bacterium]
MRVHVVSDVHGRADALARAGRGADALICLGDLLLFLDYADYGQGIFADLFGPEAARAYVELRTAKRFDEA